MPDQIADAILAAGAEADHDRRLAIRAAWDAYEAEHPQPLRARNVTDERGATIQIDDNLRLGWIGDAVDTSVHWLIGETGAPLTVSLDGNPTEQETADAQRFLDAVLEHSGGPLLQLELATIGGITGHPIIRINTHNRAPATPDNFRARPDLITLTVIAADDANASWSAEDVHRATRWELSFRAEHVDAGETTTAAGLERHTFTAVRDETGAVTSWAIAVERSDRNGTWIATGEPVTWPFPWPPIVDAQNQPAPVQFWGRSDIDAISVSLTRAGIARASDLNRTHRLHAHPSALAKGMTDAQVRNVDLSSDRITTIPDPDATIEYLELPAGAVSTSAEWLHELHDQFREHVHVPAVAAGQLDAAGALSGTALRILFAPLLQLTAVKRLTYGRLFTELARRILELGGYKGTATIAWPDLLPRNEKEEWETAQLEEAAGVSMTTALTRRGLDPANEAELRAIETQQTANTNPDPYTDSPAAATLETP